MEYQLNCGGIRNCNPNQTCLYFKIHKRAAVNEYYCCKYKLAVGCGAKGCCPNKYKCGEKSCKAVENKNESKLPHESTI
ncbi:hypothetical protein ACQ4LE_001666 [Meloidogyne hapla]